MSRGNDREHEYEPTACAHGAQHPSSAPYWQCSSIEFPVYLRLWTGIPVIFVGTPGRSVLPRVFGVSNPKEIYAIDAACYTGRFELAILGQPAGDSVHVDRHPEYHISTISFIHHGRLHRA